VSKAKPDVSQHKPDTVGVFATIDNEKATVWSLYKRGFSLVQIERATGLSEARINELLSGRRP
jgi:hypothetical protein